MENTKDFKSCNYCGEEILAVAKKCKHCREIVDLQLREIENLKKRQAQLESEKSNNNVQFNNNLIGGFEQRRGFPHLLHIFLSVITGGFWIIPWALIYLCRNKRVYY